MRIFKNEKAIKTYGEFADWLKSKGLDYEFETRKTNNDRIVIFNPEGSLSDDCVSYTACNPPKSWNVLKKVIEKKNN